MDFLDWLRETRFDRYVFFRETLLPLFEGRGPFGVGGGYWEPLDSGLGEIKFGRYRIYCSLRGQRCVMMYMGVLKLWPKFRKEHRKFCERCRAEMDSCPKGYDEENREYLYRARKQRHGRSP